jgi:hypothetical protein
MTENYSTAQTPADAILNRINALPKPPLSPEVEDILLGGLTTGLGVGGTVLGMGLGAAASQPVAGAMAGAGLGDWTGNTIRDIYRSHYGLKPVGNKHGIRFQFRNGLIKVDRLVVTAGEIVPDAYIHPYDQCQRV